MQTLTIGDSVKHNTYVGDLRVKRVNGTVATLEVISKDKVRTCKGEWKFPVVICSVKSLTKQ